MFKGRLVAIALTLGTSIATSANAFGQTGQSGYAPVNGLEMYYEIHGAGRALVLLHGALMTIEGFGELLPALAETRRVIALEQQGHGRTADIDRPLSYEQMADDTAALLRHLEIEQADVFGYSMGGGIALQIAIRHPDLVRKLVIAAANYHPEGYYPEVLKAIQELKPEDFADSPWQEAYARVAPNPEAFPALLGRIKDLDLRFEGWPRAQIQAIEAPTMVIVADSDVVRPEHAVEMFRLLGGGVPADLVGLPRSELTVLPGTTHVTLVDRAAWLTPMVTEFLDGPMPKPK
jgi:pimeloyl-ACP methyl ester carboxylesterase